MMSKWNTANDLVSSPIYPPARYAIAGADVAVLGYQVESDGMAKYLALCEVASFPSSFAFAMR